MPWNTVYDIWHVIAWLMYYFRKSLVLVFPCIQYVTTQITLISLLFGKIRELKENMLPTYEKVIKFYEWTRYQIKLKQCFRKILIFFQISWKYPRKTLWTNPVVSRIWVLLMLKKCKKKNKQMIKFLAKNNKTN